MEKAHVAAGSPFYGVRWCPKFSERFDTCLSVFGRFYAVSPVAASNWISVRDRITRSPGFHHVSQGAEQRPRKSSFKIRGIKLKPKKIKFIGEGK